MNVLSRRTALALAGAAMVTPAAAQPAELPFLRKGEVVLFQGDSITEGGRWLNSDDLNHTMGQSYAYLLAADLGARLPERNATFFNRGISGHRLADLAARWRKDTLDLKPTLLSLLVGVNDILIAPGTEIGTYEQAYDRLLAETRAALPGVRLILGEPFLLPVGAQKPTFASRFSQVQAQQAIVARLAARHSAALVGYQSAFDAAAKRAPAEHWCWDGVHPTYAGHGLMAKTWLEAAARAWPNG